MRMTPSLVHAALCGLGVLFAALVASTAWLPVPTVVDLAAAVLLFLLFVRILAVSRQLQRKSSEREQALQESEARYRHVFDRAPTAMCVVDAQEEIVASNRAYKRILDSGAKREVSEALVQPRAKGTNSSLLDRRTLADIDSFQAQLNFVGTDGTVQWLQLEGSTVDHDDAPAVRLRTLEDITPLKRAQDELRLSEAKRALQYAAVTALAGADAPDEALSNLIQAVCEHGGWDVGAVWALDTQDNALHCQHIWHTPSADLRSFTQRTRQAVLSSSTGNLGRVWAMQEPVWQPAGGADARGLSAEGVGLRSMFSFPVAFEGTMYRATEFWSRQARERDPEFEQTMMAIAAQVSARFARAAERERSEHELRLSEERYRAITEIAKDAIITIDENSDILSVNKAAERVFGYSRAELLGQSLTMLMPENLRDAHLTALKRYCRTDTKHVRWDAIEQPGLCKDGSLIVLEMTLASFIEGKRRTFTGYIRDVTQRRQEESALLHQAYHDALTDLPNRTLLQDRLQRAIATAHRLNTPVALLFLDLDRFKEVNDTLGHQSGDMLLEDIARRLERTGRDADTVSRLGGDEFALLLPGTDEGGAEQSASKVMDALRHPVTIDGQSLEISASIGIAVYPTHGRDATTLMRRADVAMYAAKRSSSGFAMYSPERDELSATRLTLTSQLRQAIEREEMVLHYQPKVRLKDHEATEVEALIRWRRPDGSLVSPDAFIPLAEETGLVKPMTVWLLKEALRQHQVWRREGLDIRVSVNLSARTIHDPRLVDLICDLLKNGNIEPSSLQVEITESALMVDPDCALESILRLRNAGVWLSIDDFGTGYSSLGYLKRLPIDEIKIDRSFVMDMSTSRDDASIVRSVVMLGHNLELQVVAEGVENKRAYDMLAAMGCDMAQGFYLSPPLPEAHLTDWLRQREVPITDARFRTA